MWKKMMYREEIEKLGIGNKVEDKDEGKNQDKR